MKGQFKGKELLAAAVFLELFFQTVCIGERVREKESEGMKEREVSSEGLKQDSAVK